MNYLMWIGNFSDKYGVSMHATAYTCSTATTQKYFHNHNERKKKKIIVAATANVNAGIIKQAHAAFWNPRRKPYLDRILGRTYRSMLLSSVILLFIVIITITIDEWATVIGGVADSLKHFLLPFPHSICLEHSQCRQIHPILFFSFLLPCHLISHSLLIFAPLFSGTPLLKPTDTNGDCDVACLCYISLDKWDNARNSAYKVHSHII